jgi:hypothetical protein
VTPELEKLAEVAIKFPDELQNSEDSAKRFLKEITDDCPVAALYAAVRALYGVNFLLWEPETLWFTLEAEGIDLSNESRDKILAAMALQLNPAFYWDNLVFQNTVQAFNDVLYVAGMLQENNVAHMSWAVYEASIIRGMDPDMGVVPDFDDDVQMYVAVCLKRAGFVVPPENLKFSEEALKILRPFESPELKNKVQEAWETLDKEHLQEFPFPEDALGVQLAKLAGCFVYVNDRAKNLAESLLRIKG